MSKTAIMDIGSNSVRLMWGKDGALNRKMILTTQLSEGMDASGYLSDAAIDRTLAAMADQSAYAKMNGAERIVAFATEAVRRASNGAAFCCLVKDRLGINVEVIDGETEARCGFSGARGLAKGRVGILDIGGASVELSVGDEAPEFVKSLPIGVVRMKERYGRNFTAFRQDLKELTSPYLDAPAFDTLIGIGGTPTSLIAVLDGFESYDPSRVHGRTVSRDALERVADETAKIGAEEFCRRYPTVAPRRAEVLPFGFYTLLGILDCLGFEALTVSEQDNLEGYARLRGLG